MSHHSPNAARRHNWLQKVCTAWVKEGHPEVYEKFRLMATERWPIKARVTTTTRALLEEAGVLDDARSGK